VIIELRKTLFMVSVVALVAYFSYESLDGTAHKPKQQYLPRLVAHYLREY
jgi:hypothetical protein